MIKIAVCDDESSFITKIKMNLEQFIKTEKELATIDVYSNSEFLLADIQEGIYFDLLLLDIEMPNKNGMDLTPLIKKSLPHALIIFITSHLEYAIDSFSLSIFRYIPKQDLNSRLFTALRDAFHFIKIEQDDVYTIRTHTNYEKIFLKDVLYIQKEGKNTVFTTFNGKSKARNSLINVYKELKKDEFLYIDKGCIVNILHIMQIKSNTVQLRNGESLFISRARISATKKSINTFWGDYL